MFWKVKTQSAKICLKFNFWGGVVFSKKSDLHSGKKIRILKFWGEGCYGKSKPKVPRSA